MARAGSSGVAYSLVSSEEFAYMMDLHLFLSRPLQFVTTQSKADEDGLIGGVPQHLIDEEDDIYKVRTLGRFARKRGPLHTFYVFSRNVQ